MRLQEHFADVGGDAKVAIHLHRRVETKEIGAGVAVGEEHLDHPVDILAIAQPGVERAPLVLCAGCRGAPHVHKQFAEDLIGAHLVVVVGGNLRARPQADFVEDDALTVGRAEDQPAELDPHRLTAWTASSEAGYRPPRL